MHLYEKKGRYIIDFTDIPTRRVEMPEIPVEERKKNFREVETGFPEDVAVAEAKRCLSCRRCLGCALCWAECKPEAIDFDLPDRDVDLHVDRIILTSGMERKTAPVSGNIDNKHMNVVTDLQVERMLAGTGPTNGLVFRPQDGEIPKKIAFVQTFGTTEEKTRDAVLVFGINEAIIARKRMDVVEISIISPEIESFKTSHRNALEKVSGIGFINGSVSSAAEVGQNKDIEVRYETDGAEKSETFGLVVLLTLPQLPPSIADAAKQLGLEVDYASFLGNREEMVETDRAGITFSQDL
jgi:heterodisulfide reductase subunit A-like polyferredoxin